MTLLEQYIDCMKKGNNVALSELFEEKGVLHDSSVNKVGQDTIHLEGKMAVDMMFHHRFCCIVRICITRIVNVWVRRT